MIGTAATGGLLLFLLPLLRFADGDRRRFLGDSTQLLFHVQFELLLRVLRGLELSGGGLHGLQLPKLLSPLLQLLPTLLLLSPPLLCLLRR